MRLLTIGIWRVQSRQGALDGARLDLPIFQLNKPLWRQAEDCAFLKADKCTERGAVGLVESLKGEPLIPLILRLKTLGKVDLIAVPAVKIALYLAKLFAVLRAAHIGLPR
ncbi:hypothetical protein D3C73_1223190 [compost metagenome]